jgi:hypothetical protein
VEALPCPPRASAGETKDGASYGGDGLRGQVPLCESFSLDVAAALAKYGWGTDGRAHAHDMQERGSSTVRYKIATLLITGDQTRIDGGPCIKLKRLEIHL